MAKTSATQYREWQAGQRVEKLIAWMRRELRVTHRTDHLDPIIDLVEWLLQTHCGGTKQVESWARDVRAVRMTVDERRAHWARVEQRGIEQRRQTQPTRPTLRVVK